MWGRAVKPAMLAVFVFSCCLTGMLMAQGAPSTERKVDPRITQLEMALNHVSQEQQSVYQQFQMLQELRRNEIQDSNPLVQGMGGVKDMPPISYDESIAQQRERKERFNQHTRDLDRLYGRYAELGEQKKVILDQLRELAKEIGR
ncbi:hypothetical protein SAMN05216299_12144 [Nitrosospira sp. Nsp14]|nr:hypothetical protein SAMN05216299_12144 [Nitrosospira sp. Nsp14]